MPACWFLLGVVLILAPPTRCERGSSDSIMDMVDTGAVDRILAAQDGTEASSSPERDFPRRNENRYKVNDEDNAVIDILRKRTNETVPYDRPEYLQDIPPFRNDKALKSKKSAITLTLKRDKEKDWCIAEPLEMEIKEEGCLPKIIRNRYCHGLCSSYFVPKEPRNLPSKRNSDYDNDYDDDDDGMSKFCAMCKPMKTSWKIVTLNCPYLSNKRMKKRVLKVKKCRCMSQDCN